MTRQVVIQPAAEAEVLEAAIWYERQNPEAARKFLEAFSLALGRLADNPFQYQIIEEDIRRAPLASFPYGLLYSAADDHVVIVSCIHGSRNPARWRERLKR